MNNRKIITAVILLGVSILAFAMSYLLLQDTRIATAGYVGLLGLTIVFVEPFIGLINYLLFLYVRPHEYVPAMMGYPVMLAIAAATAGLTILHMLASVKHRYFARAPQNFLVIWFLISIAMSHISWLYIEGAVASTTDFATIVLMYFLIANLVTSEGKLNFIFHFLILLTLVLATSGIVQYYTGTGLGGQESYKGRIQGIGIFSDPNDLALALVIVLPFLFFKLIANEGNLFQKLYILAALTVLVFALFLTESRGGLLAFGLLSILLFARRFGWGAGIMIGSMIFLAMFAFSSRMSTISTDEGSTAGRIEAWAVGLDLFEYRPLFGMGAGNFTEYHFRTAHNSFVLCMSELGLFGLMPWIMILYVSIRNMGFISRFAHESSIPNLGLYADSLRYAMIAFVAASFFLSRTYSELLFILAALCTVVTHMFRTTSDERYKLFERRDFVHSFLIVIGGWAFIKGFLYWAW